MFNIFSRLRLCIILPAVGQSIKSVLSLLKERHPPLHDALIAELNNYSTCVGLLDQGYFKRDRSGQTASLGRHHFRPSSPSSAVVSSLVFHRAISGADRRPVPQGLLHWPIGSQHLDLPNAADSLVNRTAAVSAAEQEGDSSPSGVDLSWSATAERSASLPFSGAESSDDVEHRNWLDDDRRDLLR